MPVAQRRKRDHPHDASAICRMQARLFDGTPIWLLTKMNDVKEVLQDDKDNRFSKVGPLNAGYYMRPSFSCFRQDGCCAGLTSWPC